MKTKHIYIAFAAMIVFNISNAQTLQDYLVIAKQNSSEIQEKNFEFQLAKEKINEVGNIESTSFSLGYFTSTPESRVGAQKTKLEIQQQLPWFGVLKAQKEVAQTISETKQFDIELTERELLYRVKIAYYELYLKETTIVILKDNKQILSTYETMALSALENNKATMSDVLKIRVQKNELHSKIFQNLNEIEAFSRNFNRLLQREKDTPLTIVDSLNVLDIVLSKSTIEQHPSLSKLDHISKIYKNEDLLINKERLPEIGFGLDYIFVEERSGFNITDNGKDILMPKVSLSIPLFTKKYKSKSHQIRIKQDVLVSKRESQQKQLEIALEKGILEINNAILRVVAAQKNKEETQLAINVDLKAYETGVLDYDKILRLQLQKIKFQLMEVEAIKSAFVAKSKTTYLTE